MLLVHAILPIYWCAQAHMGVHCNLHCMVHTYILQILLMHVIRMYNKEIPLLMLTIFISCCNYELTLCQIANRAHIHAHGLLICALTHAEYYIIQFSMYYTHT